jgi:hypothetical protein
MSKQAYTKGLVLARCPGCQNLHLIADNLGYFSDRRVNLETLMAEKGEEITKIDDGTWEISPDTVMGKSQSVQAIAENKDCNSVESNAVKER